MSQRKGNGVPSITAPYPENGEKRTFAQAIAQSGQFQYVHPYVTLLYGAALAFSTPEAMLTELGQARARLLDATRYKESPARAQLLTMLEQLPAMTPEQWKGIMRLMIGGLDVGSPEDESTARNTGSIPVAEGANYRG